MIIYVHGFGGSGEGTKAKLFREYFKERFIAPSLSYVPDLAIKTLEERIISYHHEAVLILNTLGKSNIHLRDRLKEKIERYQEYTKKEV